MSTFYIVVRAPPKISGGRSHRHCERARLFLRIGQVEQKVKAYLTQHRKDAALAEAGALYEKLKGWRKTKPMTGMPLAIKDNLCTGRDAANILFRLTL